MADVGIAFVLQEVIASFFLLGGFWVVHREEKKACEPGKPCAEPVRRRMKIILWVATLIAVVFATFPMWQVLVL